MKLLIFAYSMLAVSALTLQQHHQDDASRVLHEQRRYASAHFRMDKVAADAVATFKIALEQNGLDDAYAHIIDVSDPQSRNYGKLWTRDQVLSTFGPSSNAASTVSAWLAASGINGVVESRGWLSFQTTIGKAESLFSNTYYEHRDASSGTVRIGCDSYHLPPHISKHVDFIKPGVALSGPLSKRNVKRNEWPLPLGPQRPHAPATWPQPWHMPPAATHLPPDLQTCARDITPACIRALYSIPDTASDAVYSNPSASASLGIFELDIYYNQTDLDSFFAKYTSIPNGTHPSLATIDNATFVENSTVVSEADLDFDVAFSLIYPQNITLYQSVDGGLGADTRLAYGLEAALDAIDKSYCDGDDTTTTDCDTMPLTSVFSFSYGTSEFTESEAEQKRQCNEIMKLGLQGHTFVVSAGDYGVAAQASSSKSFYTNGCIDPKNVTDVPPISYTTNGTVFNPTYPSNCPYVLSDGATQLYDNHTVLDAESAMRVAAPFIADAAEGARFPPDVTFSSSGGFSNLYSRSAYQARAVDAYLADHDPGYPSYIYHDTGDLPNGTNIGANGGVYNRAGRGFPDVSANGAYFALYEYGVSGSEYGTSIAAPIWASILTLTNEKRVAAGKGTVGFVNPVLYQNPHVFYDITNGTNPGCFTDGFSAVEGWDPITGLGTPDFPRLLDLFMSLP